MDESGHGHGQDWDPDDIDPSTGLPRWGARLKADLRAEIQAVGEKVDGLVSQEHLSGRLEAFVMFKTLVPWLGAAAVIIITAAWGVASRAQDRAEAAGGAAALRAEQAVEKATTYFHESFKAVQKDVTAARRDSRSAYWASRTGRASGELERQIKETPLPAPPGQDGGM